MLNCPFRPIKKREPEGFALFSYYLILEYQTAQGKCVNFAGNIFPSL